MRKKIAQYAESYERVYASDINKLAVTAMSQADFTLRYANRADRRALLKHNGRGLLKHWSHYRTLKRESPEAMLMRMIGVPK